MDNKNTTYKVYFILTGITVFEKILSFIFQAMIASSYGANIITDSFFTSSEFITLVDSTFLNGLIIALLNQYTYKQKNNSVDQALGLLSESNLWIVSTALFLTVCIFSFADPLTYILAPGFDAQGKAYLSRDIRIICLVPLFLSLTMPFMAILRQKKDFFVIGLKSLFISVIGIFFLIVIKLYDGYETVSLSTIQVLAAFFYFIATWLASRKHYTFKYFSRPRWGDDQKKILKMWLPLIVSNGITRIALMVDRIIASNMEEGSVSCLTYAHSLYNLVHYIFILNLCSILLSDFTNMAAEKQSERLEKTISSSMKILVFILGIITILILFNSENVVKIIYGRGNFAQRSIQITGELLFYYAICLVPSAINNLFIQVFYAYGKNSTTMVVSLASISLNIIGSIVLTRYIGLKGVAVGTIFATLLMCILYFILIRKLLMKSTTWANKSFYIHCFCAYTVCFGVCFIVKKIGLMPIFTVILSGVAGISGAIITMFLVKDEIVMMGVEMIKRFCGRKQQTR
jgi:putative peptidoglycan lipid II flippase